MGEQGFDRNRLHPFILRIGFKLGTIFLRPTPEPRHLAARAASTNARGELLIASATVSVRTTGTWRVRTSSLKTRGSAHDHDARSATARFFAAAECLTLATPPPRVRQNRRSDAMKFYNSIGPNPRVVRMFMAEKGVSIPTQEVNLMKGENREGDHLKRNPHGQMPTLELDNGAFLSEITAICEYLEDKNPKPALIGTTPEEKAETRMWTRRIDLNICEPMANGFRFS